MQSSIEQVVQADGKKTPPLKSSLCHNDKLNALGKVLLAVLVGGIAMSGRSARIAALALLGLAITSCVHIGQRLLYVDIELDGQVVFTGMRGVRDDMRVEHMWGILKDVTFHTAADSADAVEDNSERTRTLSGNVVVRIKHVDRELAAVSLSSLSLTRDAPNSSWSLGKGESERIQQAIAK